MEAKPTLGDRLQNYGNYCGQFNGLGDFNGNGKAEWYNGIEPGVTNKLDGFCKEHDRCLLNPGKGCECDRKLCQQLSGSGYCKTFGCKLFAFNAKNLPCKTNCKPQGLRTIRKKCPCQSGWKDSCANLCPQKNGVKIVLLAKVGRVA